MSFLPLRTERLSLRPHRSDDAGPLLGFYRRPEVARYLLHGPWTEDIARERVTRRLTRTGVDGPERALSLVVEHEGRVIGDVALWATDETGAKGEIGWVFDPAASGRGFATEAARAVLDLGFQRYGMHRVSAQMDARNTASARVCERLGMTGEGVSRQDWWSKGEWTDSLRYAELASDHPRDHGDAIVVSAVMLPDAGGHLLTVRKRGTTRYMNPGGKPEPGEDPAACALREVREELGLDLDPQRLELVAVRRTTAANEAGRPLLATVYRHPHLAGSRRPEVTPAAEIDSARWVDPEHAGDDDTLAPLLRELTAGGLSRARA
ncbi:hypothetical protein GCM10022199_02510 [Marihabitans asiaticum]|uniref:RimJ/RimL family protein N-acetyltransferase n=1 Tax=Marihabitans asiaticum TaxID=415218 RepID=A0A560WEJ8_9MICO|nr:GNAT family N-acetyltransferase [Marihabitans asiaticum]TWD16073.1 RimJ/RimL family protein N-acetyltransferase [Marihabitans asiaticum]